MFERKKAKYNNYSEVPAKKKDEIIKRSIRAANEEQRELVQEYSRRFRHAN